MFIGKIKFAENGEEENQKQLILVVSKVRLLFVYSRKMLIAVSFSLSNY